jgi:nitrogen regulatory protein PII
MKQIVAYVKPNKLTAVTLALHGLEGLAGMSFSEVRGFGSDRISKTDPIVQPLVDYAPYTRIEMLCDDDQVSEIVWLIESAAHTGQKGDGKICALDVCRISRIQTAQPAELLV